MIDLETVGQIAAAVVNMIIAGYAAWHFSQWAFGEVCWRWKRHRLPYRMQIGGDLGNDDLYVFRTERERDAFGAGWEEGLRTVTRVTAEQAGVCVEIGGLPPERSAYLLTEGAANEAPPEDATIH
ncbi:MAG: hypothetical protein F4Y03_16100 [Alphaproteobacteria bacterium]|nr:hypothetical protein [Alphaproteobacteria bacterium]